MSPKKCKLVLKASTMYERGKTIDDDVPVQGFTIVKSINTLEYGVPGDQLDRDTVDRILKDNVTRIRQGTLTVEFI